MMTGQLEDLNHVQFHNLKHSK